VLRFRKGSGQGERQRRPGRLRPGTLLPREEKGLRQSLRRVARRSSRLPRMQASNKFRHLKCVPACSPLNGSPLAGTANASRTMSYLDHSYDHLFEGRKTLPWWPWVGNQFATSSVKTMVVGESVYEWAPRDVFVKRYAQTNGLRITHENHALRCDRDTPYVRHIERAIFLASKPSTEQKRTLWTSVVYHNLVLEVLRSKKHRPSESQYRKGWVETSNSALYMEWSRSMRSSRSRPTVA
jgi:hypothetical protein